MRVRQISFIPLGFDSTREGGIDKISLTNKQTKNDE
jgi:hypothetical protein